VSDQALRRACDLLLVATPPPAAERGSHPRALLAWALGAVAYALARRRAAQFDPLGDEESGESDDDDDDDASDDDDDDDDAGAAPSGAAVAAALKPLSVAAAVRLVDSIDTWHARSDALAAAACELADAAEAELSAREDAANAAAGAAARALAAADAEGGSLEARRRSLFCRRAPRPRDLRGIRRPSYDQREREGPTHRLKNPSTSIQKAIRGRRHSLRESYDQREDQSSTTMRKRYDQKWPTPRLRSRRTRALHHRTYRRRRSPVDARARGRLARAASSLSLSLSLSSYLSRARARGLSSARSRAAAAGAATAQRRGRRPRGAARTRRPPPRRRPARRRRSSRAARGARGCALSSRCTTVAMTWRIRRWLLKN